MKKYLLIVLLILSTFLFACKTKKQNFYGTSEYVKKVSSLKELEDLCNKTFNDSSEYAEFVYKASPGASYTSDESSSSSRNNEDYTKTNTQVDNVDEGDVVKVDGNNIYCLNGNGLIITNLDNGLMNIESKTELENYVPREMYINGKYIIIIGEIYENQKIYYDYMPINFDCYYYFHTYKTDIRMYDLTNLKDLKLVYNIVVEGNYVTSRIVDNNFVYLVGDYINNDDILPKAYDNLNGENNLFSIDNIYHFDEKAGNYLIVGKFAIDSNINNCISAYLGINYGIEYVSYKNLYVASPHYELKKTNKDYYYYDYYKIQTRIVKIDLESMLCTNCILIDGSINDRYWLDEYNDMLRCVVYFNDYNSNERYSNLYVLNKDFDIIGKINKIAPSENVYSVRFNGNEAAIVTFKKIDPLFKVDLSDPTNPKISEGLKEDGVSFYLHYVKDTPYILGLGLSTYVNEVGSVINDGIKLSLYDKSGEEAVNVSTVIFSRTKLKSVECDAIYNPKEILYDKDLDIFAFVVNIWDYKNEEITNGLYVFGFSTGELVQKAYLTDFESTFIESKSYYEMSHDAIIRSARVGNFIYTISNRKITSYSLEDFSKVSTLEIATYKTYEELEK